MKKYVILLLAGVLCSFVASAGKFIYRFSSVPLSQALNRIAEDNPSLKLNFIYNELESYTTSARIDTDNPYDALRQTVGLNPVSVKKTGDRYYVEALQHGKHIYRGRLMGSDGEPVVAATILLLSRNDSTVITYGFSDGEGKFSIPCDKSGVIGKFSSTGYHTVERTLDRYSLGTIYMTENAIRLNQVTISADPVVRTVDRQIISPTDQQRKASSNGINLILALNLPRITVDMIGNSITIDGNKEVQLRINGVEATGDEIMALNPDNIVKVEYIDNPGFQYEGAPAVMNYIVKFRNIGGNVNGNFLQGVNSPGWGRYALGGRYNTEKSVFSANVCWERRDQKWLRRNEESYHFTDRTVTNREVGDYTPLKWDQLNASLRYVYNDADKQMLSISFRNYYKDEPNSFADRNSILYQDEKEFRIADRTTTRINIPSLDIYYQLKLPKRQSLYFDVVGSYLNSRNQHTYRMTEGEDLVDAFFTDIEGTKWSLFGEGIYEKEFDFGKISGGIRQRQEWMRNIYSGDEDVDVRMVSSETSLYGEFQSKFKQVNYILGLGALRTFSRQDGRELEKYIFHPRIVVSWGAVRGLFLRLGASINGYAPSLADLSSVSRQIDAFQIRRGNPNLKAVTYYSASLNANWNICKYVSLDNFTIYNYDHKPVMEEDIAEQDIIVRTMDNQRGFHRLNSYTSVMIRPFKDYISIRLTAHYQHFKSLGNNYEHTYSSLGFNGEIFGSWRVWSVSFNFRTPFKDFWGETLRIGERNHAIDIAYTKPKWRAAICLYNPFEKVYKQTVINYSAIAPYSQTVSSKKLTKLILLKFEFNLDFGKSRESLRQRMSNEDTNTGIMSGSR